MDALFKKGAPPLTCKFCGRELLRDSVFCAYCGKKLIKKIKTTRRSNGEGSVRQLPNGKWIAEVVLWYYYDEVTQQTKPKTFSKSGFCKKADASNAIPSIREAGLRKWGRSPGKDILKRPETFSEIYDAWLPTHIASKSTMLCYSSAYKHFSPIHNEHIDNINIDDLQACIDDCAAGKRTKQNMKTLCGLMYKYAIPRNLVSSSLNLASFLVIHDEGAQNKRTGLTMDELGKLKTLIGKIPYADYVYCMCYLGFRPSEALNLTLQSYNRKEKYFIGGSKTDAGRDRIVPVAPQIQKYIDALTRNKVGGYVFCGPDGGKFNIRRFREDYFTNVIRALGINDDEREKRLLTPHCCRHTFANLLKGAKGADKNKLAIIGHTSDEMLRDYQDADIEGLREIVNSFQ